MRNPGKIAMKATPIVTMAVVALLLIGGIAAIGAASPADQAHDNATDAYDDNASVAGESPSNANEERAGNADSVGPADGLPAAVPDHVSEIHATIDGFLNESIDNLGSALSDLLSGNDNGSPT